MSNNSKTCRDRLTSKQRSELMSRVKSRDTSPEITVRKLVYGMGFRYQLRRKDLPGKPDLVFQGLKKLIFVHGCFWHKHSCSAGRNQPKSNKKYWNRKFERNVERDGENLLALKKRGWNILIIWECEIKNKEKLVKRIVLFLK